VISAYVLVARTFIDEDVRRDDVHIYKENVGGYKFLVATFIIFIMRDTLQLSTVTLKYISAYTRLTFFTRGSTRVILVSLGMMVYHMFALKILIPINKLCFGRNNTTVWSCAALPACILGLELGQCLLFMQSDLYTGTRFWTSPEFWSLLFFQELSSLIKNTGFSSYLIVWLRNLICFPLSESTRNRMEERRQTIAPLDNFAEITAPVVVAVALFFEAVFDWLPGFNRSHYLAPVGVLGAWQSAFECDLTDEHEDDAHGADHHEEGGEDEHENEHGNEHEDEHDDEHGNEDEHEEHEEHDGALGGIEDDAHGEHNDDHEDEDHHEEHDELDEEEHGDEHDDEHYHEHEDAHDEHADTQGEHDEYGDHQDEHEDHGDHDEQDEPNSRRKLVDILAVLAVLMLFRYLFCYIEIKIREYDAKKKTETKKEGNKSDKVEETENPQRRPGESSESKKGNSAMSVLYEHIVPKNALWNVQLLSAGLLGMQPIIFVLISAAMAISGAAVQCHDEHLH
jgi:hypothetical protein